MGLEIKFNVKGMVAFLDESLDALGLSLDVSDVIGTVEDLIKDGNIIKAVMEAVQYVSAVVEWLRGHNIDAAKAMDVGAESIDALLEFKGNVWGFVPIGSALEAADYPVSRLLLEAGYRAIRGTGVNKLADDAFDLLVKGILKV